VMATYFHVTLFGPARTWLMNLTPGSIYFWERSARGSLQTLPALTSNTVWRPTSTQ
jgi:hypothetical protein